MYRSLQHRFTDCVFQGVFLLFSWLFLGRSSSLVPRLGMHGAGYMRHLLSWMLLTLIRSTGCAPLNASSLDSSAVAIDGAASIMVINGDGSFDEFWSEIPSTPETYVVQVGTVLSFRFTTGHNVWLMPTEASYAACDFTSATELASQTYGGGEVPNWPNQYQAVAMEAGELLFACEAVFNSHCGRGQKIRVTVATPPPPSLPPPGDESKMVEAIIGICVGVAASCFVGGIVSFVVRLSRTRRDQMHFEGAVEPPL